MSPSPNRTIVFACYYSPSCAPNVVDDGDAVPPPPPSSCRRAWTDVHWHASVPCLVMISDCPAAMPTGRGSRRPTASILAVGVGVGVGVGGGGVVQRTTRWSCFPWALWIWLWLRMCHFGPRPSSKAADQTSAYFYDQAWFDLVEQRVLIVSRQLLQCSARTPK